MKGKAYIGVDFGGTKILTGAVTKEGQILAEPVKKPTNGQEEKEKIFGRVIDSIEETREKLKDKNVEIAGIGMGVTGPIDIKEGVILECPQLPTMHFFPLKKQIEEHFSLPVFMNNDANCLIYGEAIYGSGKGFNNMVGFTLGTGIGCAVILNRKIHDGNTGSSGEIWPSPYKDGTIEDYVSGSGVSKIYKEIVGEEKFSYEIAVLAEKGNLNAIRTWNEFGKHLSVAISWSINLIDPEVIILGGSIAEAFKFFSSAMETSLRKLICPVPAEKIKVVRAKLGSNAGLVGAAALAIFNE